MLRHGRAYVRHQAQRWHNKRIQRYKQTSLGGWVPFDGLRSLSKYKHHHRACHMCNMKYWDNSRTTEKHRVNAELTRALGQDFGPFTR